MLEIAICEDRDIERTMLRGNLEDLLKLRGLNFKILEFSSGEELLSSYSKSVDILFLDIQMKNIDGIEVARLIREFDENVEIIFTTALKEYVQKGYEVKAYRYLIKPITKEDLYKNVNSCIDYLLESNSDYLVLANKNDLLRVPIKDILYIESFKREIWIHTEDSTRISNMSMKQLDKLLINKGFFRCHTSFIVNLKRVSVLGSKNITIKNTEIPVSKYRIKELKQRLTIVLGDIVC